MGNEEYGYTLRLATGSLKNDLQVASQSIDNWSKKTKKQLKGKKKLKLLQ